MNPQSVYERLVKVGTEWADKEQAANLLEAAIKSVKAKIAIQYKESGCGVAEAEMRAAPAAPDTSLALASFRFGTRRRLR